MHGTLERTNEEEKLKLENELSLQKYMVKEGRDRYNKLKVRNDDVEASVKMWRSDSLISENKSKRLQEKVDGIVKVVKDLSDGKEDIDVDGITEFINSVYNIVGDENQNEH